MLRNDTVGHDRAKNTDITRNLKNATTRHYQNNPHMSMESAFAYIMSNSGIFRALPIECIEKARKHLALPETDDKIKKASSEKLEDIFTGLNEALQDLADSGQPLVLIPFGLSESEGATPIEWERITFDDPVDTLEASDKPKPGTTVVHAERVVVNNRKMIKILKFENVKPLIGLPTDYYMSTFPYYFRSHLVYLRVCTSKGVERSFLKSDIVSIKEFGKMIKTMKEAGVRLSKINKTAKLEKEHSGKFTVSI